MKNYILLIILSITALPSLAQNIEGTYSNKWISASGEGIEYTLILEEDGQFTFNHRRIHMGTTEDAVTEVQGTWKLRGHLLTLQTNETAEDNSTIASGLDANKARFMSVSSRHPKFNLVQPSLRFYKSDIFYANDMELVKADSDITAIN